MRTMIDDCEGKNRSSFQPEDEARLDLERSHFRALSLALPLSTGVPINGFASRSNTLAEALIAHANLVWCPTCSRHSARARGQH